MASKAQNRLSNICLSRTRILTGQESDRSLSRADSHRSLSGPICVAGRLSQDRICVSSTEDAQLSVSGVSCSA